MTEKDLAGYCEGCIGYKCKTFELAIELLNEIDSHHFREYANVKRAHTKEFEKFDSLIASLKAISSINCVTPY